MCVCVCGGGGGSAGSGQRRVMAGDGKAESETGEAQVSGGTRGETTQDWYDGTDTGDAQVGGLSCADVQWEVLTYITGGILQLAGKTDGGRGGQGGRE